jgi:hypothetical protein
MSHFLNPDKPPEEIRAHLEKKSPSRYAALEQSIIQHSLTNPTTFADRAFELFPEQYGKLALEIFNGDPGFFIKYLTGKDLDATTLKAAAEAYDPTKPAVSTNGAGASPLTAEEMEDVRLYLGDEIVKKIEAVKVPPPTDNKELETLRAENAELKTAKAPDPEQFKQQQETLFNQFLEARAAEDKVFGNGVKVLEDFAAKYADDTKTGLGLKVTDEERKLAPTVALMKDIKRELFLSGLGDLPVFEKGFGEWGKEYPEFQKLLGQAWHYAEKKEENNTVAAAQALIPYVDKYIREARMKHPAFTLIDDIIKLLTSQTNPKVTNDAIVPGAPANSQPQASAPETRIASYLLNDALSVK